MLRKLVIPLLSLLPPTFAVVLPTFGGPFNITLRASQLVDQDRVDPFNSSHEGRDDSVYATHDCNGGGYSVREVWMAVGGLKDIEMTICVVESKPLLHPPPPFVVFSPGLGDTRHLYTALAAEVASKGYTVITVDHPYDVDIVEFPDGDIIYGGRVNASDEAALADALAYRQADISFVLDTFGVPHTAGPKALMFGHSFGGAATATSMVRDKRIKGGVNLDGTIYGDAPDIGLDNHQTFVQWASEWHGREGDETWERWWQKLRGQGVWERELFIEGSEHSSYWDLPLIADVADIRKQLSEESQSILLGAVPGGRVMTIIGEYLDDYFQFALRKGAGEGLLGGPSPLYPDVQFRT